MHTCLALISWIAETFETTTVDTAGDINAVGVWIRATIIKILRSTFIISGTSSRFASEWAFWVETKLVSKTCVWYGDTFVNVFARICSGIKGEARNTGTSVMQLKLIPSESELSVDIEYNIYNVVPYRCWKALYICKFKYETVLGGARVTRSPPTW